MSLIWKHDTIDDFFPHVWIATNSDGEQVCMLHRTCDDNWLIKIDGREDELFGRNLEEAKIRVAILLGEAPILTWEDRSNTQKYGWLGGISTGIEVCKIYQFMPGTEHNPECHWNIVFYLPSAILPIGNFTLEGAKARSEEVLREWLAKTKLRPEE